MLAGTVAELGSGYSGWTYEARKSRQGLLLSPQAMGDGDLYSVRLMRSALMPRVHPGRGLVVDAGGGPAARAGALLRAPRDGSLRPAVRDPKQVPGDAARGTPGHDESGAPG